MRNVEIKVGEVYTAMVSDRVVPVRVESHHCTASRKGRGGHEWPCRNLRTGRSILVKSAQRFREHIPAAEVQSHLEVIHS